MSLEFELRSLPRSHLKGEPLPLLVHLPFKDHNASGWYVAPDDGLYELPDQSLVPARNGIIVVFDTNDPSTVFHEYRHHMQALARALPKTKQSFSFDYEHYWLDIRRFFRAQPFEMDALRYQQRHCPTLLAEEWLDVVLTASEVQSA